VRKIPFGWRKAHQLAYFSSMPEYPVYTGQSSSDHESGVASLNPGTLPQDDELRNGNRRRRLAVLCPVYNEDVAIPLFLDRSMALFARLKNRCDPALYFIDNGCTDGSLEAIREAHSRHPNVFVLVLSRNFGYQCALRVGLQCIDADIYVMIDVDCEDPPEMIEQFYSEYEAGYDIVYGERVDRPENFLLRGTRKLFYRIVRSVADDDVILNMAEFSLITAEVRDAVIDEVTSFPFLRAAIARVGFRRKNIPYRRHRRVAGETHYNLLGMTVFAVAGILSASTLGLRIPAYAFPFWAVGMAGIALASAIRPSPWHVPALLTLGFLFIGFTTMTSGLYVARTYKNALFRPNGIVRRSLSILPNDASSKRDQCATR
jgi:polyisoprenyl-phosphate glycosyltransferase